MIGDLYPNLCDADRKFAQHVALVWDSWSPWEFGIPQIVIGPAPIEHPESNWFRRNRERLDLWRRENGVDWVKHARTR